MQTYKKSDRPSMNFNALCLPLIILALSENKLGIEMTN